MVGVISLERFIVAAFNAYVLTNKAGELVHKIVFLVRRPPFTHKIDTPLPMKDLHEHVLKRYDQLLQPFDIEVLDPEDMKKRIKKLNRGR